MPTEVPSVRNSDRDSDSERPHALSGVGATEPDCELTAIRTKKKILVRKFLYWPPMSCGRALKTFVAEFESARAAIASLPLRSKD